MGCLLDDLKLNRESCRMLTTTGGRFGYKKLFKRAKYGAGSGDRRPLCMVVFFRYSWRIPDMSDEERMCICVTTIRIDLTCVYPRRF